MYLIDNDLVEPRWQWRLKMLVRALILSGSAVAAGSAILSFSLANSYAIELAAVKRVPVEAIMITEQTALQTKPVTLTTTDGVSITTISWQEPFNGGFTTVHSGQGFTGEFNHGAEHQHSGDESGDGGRDF